MKKRVCTEAYLLTVSCLCAIFYLISRIWEPVECGGPLCLICSPYAAAERLDGFLEKNRGKLYGRRPPESSSYTLSLSWHKKTSKATQDNPMERIITRLTQPEPVTKNHQKWPNKEGRYWCSPAWSTWSMEGSIGSEERDLPVWCGCDLPGT